MERLPLPVAMRISRLLTLADLKSMMDVSRALKNFVKIYVAARLRLLLRHFHFRPAFHESLLHNERVLLGGIAIARMALNLPHYGYELRIYTNTDAYEEVEQELFLSGYVNISSLNAVAPVLSLSPTVMKHIWFRASHGGYRFIHVEVVRAHFVPESAISTTLTLASMCYATNSSITTFFPSLFFDRTTLVRRIPTAIKLSEMFDWAAGHDLPVPVEDEIYHLRKMGFKVGYGYVPAADTPCRAWECPTMAFEVLRPLFSSIDFGDRTTSDKVLRLRRSLAEQSRLTQYGPCLRGICYARGDSDSDRWAVVWRSRITAPLTRILQRLWSPLESIYGYRQS